MSEEIDLEQAGEFEDLIDKCTESLIGVASHELFDRLEVDYVDEIAQNLYNEIKKHNHDSSSMYYDVFVPICIAKIFDKLLELNYWEEKFQNTTIQ
ncbi:hypothetical protein [Fundidesulfovibrio putealis]|uniref:hypothetical protein n=1 Tax=Fundidesulfovibrio putealis TaxID=270496 RepID=UPI0004856329|nr:hypothetical protein [Fundidesulfovibrio putealis]